MNRPSGLYMVGGTKGGEGVGGVRLTRCLLGSLNCISFLPAQANPAYQSTSLSGGGGGGDWTFHPQEMGDKVYPKHSGLLGPILSFLPPNRQNPQAEGPVTLLLPLYTPALVYYRLVRAAQRRAKENWTAVGFQACPGHCLSLKFCKSRSISSDL